MASVDATFTRRKILRDELIGLFGVVERNLYLTRRYIWWDLAFFVWTIANTLTVVFIAAAVMMLIGAVASLFNPGRYATAPGADNAS